MKKAIILKVLICHSIFNVSILLNTTWNFHRNQNQTSSKPPKKKEKTHHFSMELGIDSSKGLLSQPSEFLWE